MQKLSPKLYETVIQSLQCDSSDCLYDQVDLMNGGWMHEYRLVAQEDILFMQWIRIMEPP